MRALQLAIVVVVACGEKHPRPQAPPNPPSDGASSTVKSIDAGVATDDAAPVAQPIAALAITGIEPAKGDADGGTYARIIGRGFIKDGPRSAKVYFGSRQGTIVRFASDSELIVQAPGGTAGEAVDLLVIFEPGGTLKLPGGFTFIEKAGGPTIDDLQPQTGGVKIVGAGTGSEGTLTSAAVMQRIQSAYFAGLKRCYTDYLKTKDAAAKGKVSLTFTVTSRGKTSGITVSGFAKPVDDCLSKLMTSWTFPIPKKDGSPQDASFNVVLQLVPD